MNLLHRSFSIICFLVGWLYTFSIATIAVLLFPINHAWGQGCQRLFGLGNLWLLNIDVSFFGIKNLKDLNGAIFAPNHESLFDILVIAALPCEKTWIAKKQIKYIPFIGQVMQAMGSYFVARNRSEKDVRVLGDVEEALQRGARIVIFPEGTRTRTGALLPFKKGAFRTAVNAGVSIVPIAITGTYQIAPPGKWPTRSHKVFVRIGKALTPGEKETTEKITERYRAALLDLLSLDRCPSPQ